MARDFSCRADTQTRRRHVGHCLNSINVFCLACQRSVSRGIDTQMAPRMGARFVGLRRSFFPNGWCCEFWIFHWLWFAVAENMERRDRSVFSVLANKLRLVDSPRAGAGRLLCLARLESRLALGKQTSCGRRLCVTRGCDLRGRLLLPNRALGLGQPQTHGLGLLSYPAFSLERHHRTLGVSRTRGNVHCAFPFRIFYVPRRVVSRSPSPLT